MWEVIFSKKTSKTIKKLPKGNREKLKEIIFSLRNSPYSYPFRKIEGELSTYRIRLGRFRILDEVDKQNKRIVILKVELQSKAYD